MLVYGDVEGSAEARTLQGEVVNLLQGSYALPVPAERHAQLVSAFLTASDLVCGLLDREVTASGMDAITPAAEIGSRALLNLAGALDVSWRSGLLDATRIETAADLVGSLHAVGRLRVKPLEGYAHYAVFPQAYAEAARRSRLGSQTRVIGIRSIGLSLAAMVAAALRAPDYLSLRPVGHPFDRKVALSPGLARRLLGGNPAQFAIVDEGPGLSGSSFAAVANWLVAHGVDRAAIHFFPSHPHDPGQQAGEERLRHWHAARRHHVPTDEVLLAPDGALARAVGQLVGPLEEPLIDLSGGQWRDRVAGAELAPVALQWERRKFLARTPTSQWLVKFAGLGDWGEKKRQVADKLHELGLGPEVAGMCHGFLVQRWHEAPSLPSLDLARTTLVDELSTYLAARSGFAAGELRGASLARLAEMAEYNTAEALGPHAGNAIAMRLERPDQLQPMVRPVLVDARMHRWEWLVLRGRLLKTDAVDHALAHDLIGPQDIAWDVAGAIVEHELNGRETAGLIAGLELKSGQPLSRPLLDFMMPCYLAFQLGSWSMGGQADTPVCRRYAALLTQLAGAPRHQNAISALTKPSGRSRVALSASPSPSSA